MKKMLILWNKKENKHLLNKIYYLHDNSTKEEDTYKFRIYAKNLARSSETLNTIILKEHG